MPQTRRRKNKAMGRYLRPRVSLAEVDMQESMNPQSTIQKKNKSKKSKLKRMIGIVNQTFKRNNNKKSDIINNTCQKVKNDLNSIYWSNRHKIDKIVGLDYDKKEKIENISKTTVQTLNKYKKDLNVLLKLVKKHIESIKYPTVEYSDTDSELEETKQMIDDTTDLQSLLKRSTI